MPQHALDAFDRRRAALADGRLFLVTGFPKSGTTWVHTILDAHPAILCRGEDDLNKLGDLLAPAVSEYNRHSQMRNAPLPKNNFARFDNADLRALTAAAAVVLWGRDGDRPGIERVGAKTNALAMNNTEMLCDLFGPLTLVHVIRDVRDVMVSGYANNLRVNPEQTRARWPTLADILRDMMPAWRNSLKTLRAVGSKPHVEMIELRYEDLLADPAAEIAKLYGALGVDAAPETVAEVVEATRFERMAGGRQAGDEAEAAFMRKGVAGDWREKFDAACHRVCAELDVAGMLREAGYPGDAD